MLPPPPTSTLFPYTTLFRSRRILKPQGVLIAAAISRFASFFDGLARGFFSDLEFRKIVAGRSEEHTSELQSRRDLVCRLLLEKKKIKHEVILIDKHKEKFTE